MAFGTLLNKTSRVYLKYVCLRCESNKYCCAWFGNLHSCDSSEDIRWTLISTPGPSRPHIMHIGWQNKDIPRMWTDFAKTSLYSIQSGADHTHQKYDCKFAFCLPAITFVFFFVLFWKGNNNTLLDLHNFSYYTKVESKNYLNFSFQYFQVHNMLPNLSTVTAPKIC